jgi:hypothetical protein
MITALSAYFGILQAQLLQADASSSDGSFDAAVVVQPNQKSAQASSSQHQLMPIQWSDETRPCSAGQEQVGRQSGWCMYAALSVVRIL